MPTTDDFSQPSDIFDAKKDEPHLPQDGDTPTSPDSDPSSNSIVPTDPHTDYKSDIDDTELYNDGMADASGANDGDEPNDPEPGSRVG